MKESQTYQELEWIPATNFRLHHLESRMPDSRWETAKLYWQLPLFLYRGTRYMWEDSHYRRDAQGNTASEILLHNQKEKEFMETLEAYPGDTVIQVDSSPDGICALCPIGKHCIATNYRWKGCLIDVVKVEQKMLRRIVNNLTYQGCQPDVDFRIIRTQGDFMDYHKQNIWTFSIQPQPITVEYDSLQLKMRALRKIL